MADLYILNQEDKIQTVYSNKSENAPAFWDAPFMEELNKESELTFKVLGNQKDAKHITPENQVVFEDKDRDFRLFIIKEVEQTDEDIAEIEATCEPAYLELNDDIIEDRRNREYTAKEALEKALKDTRWESGKVDDLGKETNNFYYVNVVEAIEDILDTWGAELKTRVKIEDNEIKHRYIDILERRGEDVGKKWEMGKDVTSFSRTIKSYPKTAMYGRGASKNKNSVDDSDIDNDSDDDEEGHSRKLDFGDVVWKIEDDDPADKSADQKWVGDEDARKKFGRKNKDGEMEHRFGIFEDDDIDDKEELLEKTWEELQDQKEQSQNFEMDVVLLGELTGYGHEKVRLGDTTHMISHNFHEPVEVRERVIKFEYDLADEDNSGKVELGDYNDLVTDDDRLEKVESELGDNKDKWDEASEPITDDRFPDDKPEVPSDFKATGIFSSVKLTWEYESASYVSNYELYGSKNEGFDPDNENLIYRGKTSSYSHSVDPDETWYYRLRAVNTHDTKSEFTREKSADTKYIKTDDMLFGSVTKDILDDLSVEADKLADESVKEEKIANAAVGNAAIKNAVIDNSHLKDAIIDDAHIKELSGEVFKTKSIKSDKLDVSDLSAVSADLGKVTAGEIEGVTGTFEGKVSSFKEESTENSDSEFESQLVSGVEIDDGIIGGISRETVANIGSQSELGSFVLDNEGLKFTTYQYNHYGTNLIDTGRVQKGKKVDYKKGKRKDGDNKDYLSHYIHVNEKTEYETDGVLTNDDYGIAFYDKEKDYLDGTQDKDFKTPKDCKYVRVTIEKPKLQDCYLRKKDEINDMPVEKGEVLDWIDDPTVPVLYKTIFSGKKLRMEDERSNSFELTMNTDREGAELNSTLTVNKGLYLDHDHILTSLRIVRDSDTEVYEDAAWKIADAGDFTDNSQLKIDFTKFTLDLDEFKVNASNKTEIESDEVILSSKDGDLRFYKNGALHLEIDGKKKWQASHNGNITADGWVKGKEFKNSSSEKIKQDISEWDKDAVDLINESTIYNFRFIKDVDEFGDDANYTQGLIIGKDYNLPDDIVEEDEDEGEKDETINIYRMTSWSWKAIQELDKRLQKLED